MKRLFIVLILGICAPAQASVMSLEHPDAYSLREPALPNQATSLVRPAPANADRNVINLRASQPRLPNTIMADLFAEFAAEGIDFRRSQASVFDFRSTIEFESTGAEVGENEAANAVPLPGAAWLFLSGCAGLLLNRWRKQ